MTTALMERTHPASNEWNHSCTAQCPNPCPASSRVTRPEIDIAHGPEMTRPVN